MLEQANPIVTCVRRVPDGGWGWAVLTAASLANVLTCGLLKCIRHERERVKHQRIIYSTMSKSTPDNIKKNIFSKAISIQYTWSTKTA